MQLVRNIIGLIGAVLLMGLLGFGAFILWRTHPTVNVGIFLAAGGIIYTVVILYALNR